MLTSQWPWWANGGEKVPKAWLIVALMESSELWYHKLEVRGVQYDIDRDSTLGDRVGEDLVIADKDLFRACRGGLR